MKILNIMLCIISQSLMEFKVPQMSLQTAIFDLFAIEGINQINIVAIAFGFEFQEVLP